MKIQKQFNIRKEILLLSPQRVVQIIAMSKTTFKTLFTALLVCGGALAVAQTNNILIQLGPDEIGENQPWTISVTVNNDRLKSYDNFPDIDGFKKRGTSTQSQTSMINGQISSSQGVIMTYFPTKQGTFTVPSFKMKVNDQLISVAGKRIKVGPPAQQRSTDPFRSLFERDPAQDFFGRGETEFVDVKEDAFLALTTNKDEVYVGEGFTATLSFLVADNNRAPMQFYELGKQLADILKKLRPSTCWEENFNIENIEGEPVDINGKGYTQYKIYRATFFPLNTQPVTFPSVGLEMIKFKVAKNPSFFGQNRKEDFKTFNSKSKTIRVKELPPHPLRDAVAVGDYRVEERLNKTNLTTGQSISYDFNIYGEGNISAIEKPILKRDNNFEFYEPNMRQNVSRENGRVTGTKLFSYFMIPREPGQYNLGDYFQWVYFNPATKKYDTLRSQQVVNVSGESQQNQSIESTDLGSFYDQIESTDNTLRARAEQNWLRLGSSLFAVLLLGASAFMVFKK
jgi:hypothetical protein